MILFVTKNSNKINHVTCFCHVILFSFINRKNCLPRRRGSPLPQRHSDPLPQQRGKQAFLATAPRHVTASTAWQVADTATSSPATAAWQASCHCHSAMASHHYHAGVATPCHGGVASRILVMTPPPIYESGYLTRVVRWVYKFCREI